MSKRNLGIMAAFAIMYSDKDISRIMDDKTFTKPNYQNYQNKNNKHTYNHKGKGRGR